MEPDVFSDERGSFAVQWSQTAFAKHGIAELPVQSNFSFSKKKGTVRGMHFQRSPHEQAKLVRCPRGAIFDVVVDLRKGSSSYLSWFGQELTAENRLSMWVPRGCAHGFQTLQPETEVAYFVTAPYAPEAEAGILWNDPRVAVQWPLAATYMSEKDKKYPLL